jgi:Tfp pilus assembly protein PilN
VKRPLNLARRPLRNERLPTLLLAVGCGALAVFSVGHALAARDVLPGRTTNVERQVVTLEQELGRLRTESAELGARSATPTALHEWAAVRRLVDARAFSWTRLLASLEETVPPTVRLVSIAPDESEGRIEVRLTAEGRGVEDGLAFLKALQASRDFEGAFLTSVAEAQREIEFSYTVTYRPAGAAGGQS